jgi:DUF1016 N-terminal domain
MSGFSRTNLYRMRAFHLAYRDTNEIVPQAVGQISGSGPPEIMAGIPWGHNVVLVEQVKGASARLWYAHKTVEQTDADEQKGYADSSHAELADGTRGFRRSRRQSRLNGVWRPPIGAEGFCIAEDRRRGQETCAELRTYTPRGAKIIERLPQDVRRRIPSVEGSSSERQLHAGLSLRRDPGSQLCKRRLHKSPVPQLDACRESGEPQEANLVRRGFLRGSALLSSQASLLCSDRGSLPSPQQWRAELDGEARDSWDKDELS